VNPNLRAFLDMLKVSEGTSTHPLTKCGGYDVVVTGLDGPEVFTDFSTHPFCVHPPRQPKVINHSGLRSDAAGGFQLMARYWPIYMLQLKLQDFGPAAQDCIAVQQIKERHALDDILTGHFQIAVAKVSNIWASLPGAGYGQHENRMDVLADAYERAGGQFA
jgi:muramidase (phage lysozyme)